MKKYIVLLSAFLLLAGAELCAQQITRFGVVDTALVYTTYFRESSAVRNYDAKKTEFQTEINTRTEELKKLQQQKLDYQKAGNTTAEMRVTSEITKKSEFLTEYTRAKNIELEALRKKLESSDSFYESLYTVIGRIAESEGYSMILSLQQANTILWYSPTVDITDKVISALSSIQ
jgi:outer membrane protein